MCSYIMYKNGIYYVIGIYGMLFNTCVNMRLLKIDTIFFNNLIAHAIFIVPIMKINFKMLQQSRIYNIANNIFNIITIHRKLYKYVFQGGRLIFTFDNTPLGRCIYNIYIINVRTLPTYNCI